MKSPEWKQRVLLVSNDRDVRGILSSAFGPETTFVPVESSEDAIKQLDTYPFQVVIIDSATTDPNLHYSDDQQSTSFLEISQYAKQLYPGCTLIVVVKKLRSSDGSFAKKCGATLIMDRRNISKNALIYVIRELRARTYRTVLRRDLQEGKSFDVALYHYLPANQRYAIFLSVGEPFTAEKRDRIDKHGIRHLYVLESDLDRLLSKLRQEKQEPRLTIEMARIRQIYRRIIINLFDCSTDGSLRMGKDILEDARLLVMTLMALIEHFPTPQDCISELPYPRWSGIAHGINCAIYAILFGNQCGLENTFDLAMAALFHNLGLSEIDQKLLMKQESEHTEADLAEYRKHVEASLAMLKRKLVPAGDSIERMILEHHEQFDGFGFPNGLGGPQLKKDSGLLAIIGSFDHCHAIHPGQTARSAAESWRQLKDFHLNGSPGHGKFVPELLEALDPLFSPAATGHG